ncbi:uncharacterized protein LOC112638954 [Camponotus floridanus]|uniref:uncharacterized protein LOC112638954 n=1 Tax=Camponotus floridanus TaxID=104421 RepID=UPI000DC6B932|nr:uncharacterized protein LOC112638954 [Camponotus floridanus]
MEYIYENCPEWKKRFSNLLCVLLVKLAFHWESQDDIQIPGFINIQRRQWVRAERRWRRHDLSFMWGDAPESPPNDEDIFDLRRLFGEEPYMEEEIWVPGEFRAPNGVQNGEHR